MQYKDKDKTCEDSKINEFFDLPIITVCLNMMVFLHIFHAIRLIYKLLDKLRKRRTKFQGLGVFKCLLMDCYCCLGTTIYIYT